MYDLSSLLKNILWIFGCATSVYGGKEECKHGKKVSADIFLNDELYWYSRKMEFTYYVIRVFEHSLSAIILNEDHIGSNEDSYQHFVLLEQLLP